MMGQRDGEDNGNHNSPDQKHDEHATKTPPRALLESFRLYEMGHTGFNVRSRLRNLCEEGKSMNPLMSTWFPQQEQIH